MTEPDPTAPAEDVPPVDPAPADPAPEPELPPQTEIGDVSVSQASPDTEPPASEVQADAEPIETGQNTPEVLADAVVESETYTDGAGTDRLVPSLGQATGNPTSPDIELTPEAAAVLEGMDTIKRVEY
jgi:hypothetical protein